MNAADFEHFVELPENDDLLFELVEGVVVLYSYQSMRVYSMTDVIESDILPGFTLAVRDIYPKDFEKS